MSDDRKHTVATMSNRTILGYLAGVASGATAAPVLAYLWTIVERSVADPGAAPTEQALPLSGWLMVLVAALILLLLWAALALALSFVPFVLVWWVAVRLHIVGWVYHAVCGGVSGAILSIVFLAVASAGSLPTQAVQARTAMCFFFGGTLGGLVYWWIAVHGASGRISESR